VLKAKKVFETLHRINTAVNHGTKYVPDPEKWKRLDYWNTEHDGEGDCEDYALEKRKRLQKLYPDHKDSFLIATCFVEGDNGETGRGGYHAVLLAITDKGVYVLDNRHESVMPWKDLPYRFDRREPNAEERKKYSNKWITMQ